MVPWAPSAGARTGFSNDKAAEARVLEASVRGSEPDQKQGGGAAYDRVLKNWNTDMLGFWILALLLVVLIASVPAYPYSREWGYWPAGILLAILIFWFLLIYFGTVAFWWPWAPVAV